MNRLWLCAVCVCSVACHLEDDKRPAQAQPAVAQVQEPKPVKATLVVMVEPDASRWAGVLFEIENGWHIYGKVSGDSGLPTRVSWRLPEGVSASEVHYPPSKRFTDTGDIVTYGYSDEVLLLSEISLEKAASLPVQLGAEAKWLACQASQCIPGEAKLSQDLPAQPTQDAKITALFQRYKPTTP